MKAAYINQPGPPEAIRYGDLPQPKPIGSQVLVRIAAVAVNPIDTYIRGGMIPVELPKPYIVGCDLAGTVEAVGPDATRFKPGTRVWGSNQGPPDGQGTFAEFVAVDECGLYPTPDDVEDQTAAAGATVSVTTHLGLIHHAQLQAGETLFVNGGTGGIGSAVVQMAKALGARVIATAGSDEKVDICHELGADLAINYKTGDIPQRVREFAPDGVDIWWETVREPNFDRTIELLACGGRMILMAGRDARSEFPVGPFYVKDCRLLGFATCNTSADVRRRAADQINGWLTTGQYQPRIDRVLPLSETAAAHALQEENTIHHAGTLAGKIVLVP